MSRQTLYLAFIILLVPVISEAKIKCGNNQYWVNSHYRNSYIRHDGVRVKATQVQGHCRKNPRGYKVWSQRLSNHRPKVWGYSNEKSKKWTTEERIDFAIKAGWKSKVVFNREYYIQRKDKVNIKADSTDSPEEDFTNHIEMFLFKPNLLKKKSPSAYDWIENKFSKSFTLKEAQ